MQRRECLNAIFSSVVLFGSMRGESLTAAKQVPREDDKPPAKLQKPKAEWRALLSPEEYGVLFEERTERAFTSPLNSEKRQGTYICAACYLPLFNSRAKFDSGTGWPSFYEPIAGRLGTKRDYKLILPRIEYHCARCGGHQGHVFDDGPPPTGQRWCNNGVALKFVPAGESLPPLRV
jgi:peptide-methionine (R)-S-oxide reductase